MYRVLMERLPVYFMALAYFARLGVGQIPNARPEPSLRKFNSTSVNNYIASLLPKFQDPDLGTMFSNSLPNTLDTTVLVATSEDSFIITGDIRAMWLRDSTNQLNPYFQIPNPDKALVQLLRGAVLRQLRSVLLDGYANAFNVGPNGQGHQTDKRYPPMTPSVFEGKFELDSLAAVLKLSHNYWRLSGDKSVFDNATSPYITAVSKITSIIEMQQNSTKEDGDHPAYNFSRPPEVYPLAPAARCGLSKCGFRPSDDETALPFLIPANAMAAAELHNTAALLRSLQDARAAPLARKASALASQLREAVGQHGTGVPPSATLGSDAASAAVYSYEVDGFGKQTFVDDANVPSLLSLPYLNFTSASDPVYQQTRARLLSQENKYYFVGKEGSGIGSPHTPDNYIWPMAVSLQALTSDSDVEIKECLQTLKNSAYTTGLMHESFDKNDATKFTRPWFAWANSLFGELIIKLAEEKPHIIFKSANFSHASRRPPGL